MGKNSSFPFDATEWIRLMDEHDLEIQGAWIAIKCRLWWSDTRGKSSKSLREWSRILKKSEKKSLEIINTLLSKGTANGNVLDNQNITIIDADMMEQDRISKLRQKVGKLGGNPSLKNDLLNQKDNQDANQNGEDRLTSDDCSAHKKYIKTTSLLKINYNTSVHTWENITEKDIQIWKAAYPNVDIQRELNKAAAWIESNPKKKKKDYHRFLNGWLSRAVPDPTGPKPTNQPRYLTVEEMLSD